MYIYINLKGNVIRLIWIIMFKRVILFEIFMNKGYRD